MTDILIGNCRLIHGDTLEQMAMLPDGSVDMILCDLPYGILKTCKWDSVIPFDKLWEQYKRIIKSNGAIVLFGSQPFTSALVMSNPNMFKYEAIWQKDRVSNVFQIRTSLGRAHENILIFSMGDIKYDAKNKMTYNPQGVTETIPRNQYYSASI